jgi:hypothetical protein
MSNGSDAQFVTNADSRSGAPTSITVEILDDGRVGLSIQPTTSAALTPDQVAALRAQLGDALTIALQDARTGRR